jgi:hypothetical protein
MHDGWYTREEIAGLTGLSARSVDRALAVASATAIKTAQSDGPGRPHKLYHYTVHPILAARHLAPATTILAAPPESADPPPPPTPATGGALFSPPKPAPGIHPSDLALAALRAEAVQEYLARRPTM